VVVGWVAGALVGVGLAVGATVWRGRCRAGAGRAEATVTGPKDPATGRTIVVTAAGARWRSTVCAEATPAAVVPAAPRATTAVTTKRARAGLR
jgi:hypothetical protein